MYWSHDPEAASQILDGEFQPYKKKYLVSQTAELGPRSPATHKGGEQRWDREGPFLMDNPRSLILEIISGVSERGLFYV
ncbi:hypothetical protein A2361_00655 [Candidatus Woesebacteria bacterium RIFOXYB1_FULL_40_26]|uniref:Uncharacterized protein n=1 Tax=Candidatus Woesebacteria bacterium RIFOXYB1_FULL_40_26 TaxID=1802539 RepID=A0A1F8CVR6_9BACT|nr:MAG: hypothetical protein A2361_00655 [Candidatus Woesebacteria bacterium RIFOXYB1_FULL_40_26]